MGGRGPLGSPHTGPSSRVRRLFPLCNRSHVSTFVHALERRALSGSDLGGAVLSLLITLCGESYAERVKRVEWQRAWIYPRPTVSHRAAPLVYHSSLGSSTPRLTGGRKTLQQRRRMNADQTSVNKEPDCRNQLWIRSAYFSDAKTIFSA